MHCMKFINLLIKEFISTNSISLNNTSIITEQSWKVSLPMGQQLIAQSQRVSVYKR